MIKVLNFLEETTSEGRIRHHILANKYQLATKEFKFSDLKVEELLAEGVAPFNPASSYKLIHKAIEISKLGPGSYFGDSHSFIVGNHERMLSPAGNDDISIRKFAVGNETDFIGRLHPSAVTVISKNRLEVASVSKLDFYKFSTIQTWKIVAAQKILRITIDGVAQSYLDHANWTRYRKRHIKRVLELRSLRRQKDEDYRIEWMNK